MQIENIWAEIYSAVSITLVISVFAVLLNLYGRLFIGLIKIQKLEGESIYIATGMAITTFLAWYSYKLGAPAGIFIVIIFFTALVILILKLMWQLKYFKKNKKIQINISPSSYYLPILALFFTIQAIIALGSANNLIGRIGNNDIFSWTLIADQLLGATNIDNILPGGSSFAQSMQTDAWGTYFILAMTAKFIGLSALESTPHFTIFCLTIITFCAYEIIKKSFNFNDFTSLFIAMLTGAGSFLFYIAYNGFYAQLLATFLYLSVILIILELENSFNNSAFIQSIVIYSFLFAGLLLVYQSGFFIFTLFSFALSTVYAVLKIYFKPRLSPIEIRTDLFSWLSLPFGALLAMVILPELTLHTIKRIMVVAEAAAGWPLELISPIYLLSIPVLPPFPELTGRPWHYIVATVTLITIFTFTLLGYKKKAEKLPIKLLSLFIFYCLTLLIYVIFYFQKGGIYQAWKLAAFVVLPTSFIMVAILAKNFSYFFGDYLKLKICLVTIFSLVSLSLLVAMPKQSNLESFSNRIDHLHSISKILYTDNIKNVILATPPYGETMAVFNILSKDFILYPLSNSYLPPVNPEMINQLDPKKTRVVIPAKCVSTLPDGIVNEGYKVINFSEMQFSKVFFNLKGADCALNFGVKLLEGFSGAEPWGTWTVGNKAKLTVIVPQNLIGKDNIFSFEVNPFGNQNISIFINERKFSSILLTKPTVLNIDIPSDIKNSGTINFEFLIQSPRLAKEFNADNNDPRLLGLGFISLSIESQK